ncbi:MAG TPA: alpha-ketoglutarate-dependent dioxygenase AlkB [Acidimicrobiia bacterium]|nr:alpha-ketoglutarate-dependent dioxygenase AlkB [Acidimicrobiia bacterium]
MFAVEPLQPSLFAESEPVADTAFATLERVDLDPESWLDFAPGWLAGDARLFDLLTESVEWRQPEVRMYDRMVKTPRLVGTVDPEAHPVIPRLVEILSNRYGIRLDRVSAGWYRTGIDSVAWHGDRIARDLPHSIVATVSLGGPRRFLIRPKGGGRSIGFDLGRGDLVVMGGACQRLWEHTIPKTAAAPPRIALMFRHSYD